MPPVSSTSTPSLTHVNVTQGSQGTADTALSLRSQVSVGCVVRTQSAYLMSPVRNLRVSAAQITVVTDLIALRWIAVLSRSVILMQTACMTHSNYGTSVCVEMVSQGMDLPVNLRVVRSTMTVMSTPSVYLTLGIPTGTPVAVTKDTEGTGNGVNKKRYPVTRSTTVRRLLNVCTASLWTPTDVAVVLVTMVTEHPVSQVVTIARETLLSVMEMQTVSPMETSTSVSATLVSVVMARSATGQVLRIT